MDVFRILKEPFWTDPLSVRGAEIAPGRWNTSGQGILYTSSSPALALLETIAHLPQSAYEQLPALRLFTLSIPQEDVRWIDPRSLPIDWAEPEQLPLTQPFFSEWLNEPADLALAVPSAILLVSVNFLIHPQHPRFDQIQIRSGYDLPFNRRLWRL